MKVRTMLAALAGAALLLPAAARAQMTLRPADRPLVTAEQEGWYLRGEAITYDGSFYFPAGPEVYFNPFEMVRSGYYRGIPLYARTTIEPYSIVFVPLAGGLMQPYERRRAGEVAATVGSFAPSFPVQRDLEVPGDFMAEAPAPAMATDRFYALRPGEGMGHWHVRHHHEPAPEEPPATGELQPLRSALQPHGLNAFYIDYDNARWFNSGRAVIPDPASLTRAGTYEGFDVFTSRDAGPDTIYVPVSHTAEALMTPYTRKP